MSLIQRLARLQFYDHNTLNHQISNVLANHDPVIPHLDRHLLRDMKAGLAQLMSQGILIHLLQKA